MRSLLFYLADKFADSDLCLLALKLKIGAAAVAASAITVLLAGRQLLAQVPGFVDPSQAGLWSERGYLLSAIVALVVIILYGARVSLTYFLYDRKAADEKQQTCIDANTAALLEVKGAISQFNNHFASAAMRSLDTAMEHTSTPLHTATRRPFHSKQD